MSSADGGDIFDATLQVCGERTRVVCVRFARRVLLAVTQTQAFGAVVLAGAEAPLAGSGSDAGGYFVRGLLGCASAFDDGDALDDAPLLLARRAAALVAADAGAAASDVLVSLALAPRLRADAALAMLAVQAVLAYSERARPWRARPAPPAVAEPTPDDAAAAAAAAAARLHYAATLRVGPGKRPLDAEEVAVDA